jgi:hypothetical protein
VGTYPCPYTADKTKVVSSGKLGAAPFAGACAGDVEMAEARERGGGARICDGLFHGICLLAGGSPGRAARATRLPEVAEVLCELLARGGPVGLDAVAELDHVALEVELVLLEPRHVELLARGAALQLAVDVLVVVTNNPACG